MGLLDKVRGLSLPSMLAKGGVHGGSAISFHGDSWFQAGYDSPGQRESRLAFSGVYSCVNSISQDISKLPLQLFKTNPDGGRTEVTKHPLVTLFQKPNHYQTRMQFFLQIMMSLLYRGNAYMFVEKNGRNDPTALYPLTPDYVAPYVGVEGDVFYNVARDPLRPDLITTMIPDRYMVHLRLMTVSHPLLGVSPIYGAAHSADAGNAILNQSKNFFYRMARPSGVLKTPNTLKQNVIDRLRGQWDEYYGGNNTGRVAILEQGLDWSQLTMSAVDAQLIDQLKWSVTDVARCYRVPGFMIGDIDKVTYKNSETLMRLYYDGCLSFYIELLENGLETFFDLETQGLELEFDIGPMMRMELDARMDAYSKGIQGGIYTPNEVRAREGLNPMPGGEKLYMQGQMTPITKLGIDPVVPGAGAPSTPSKDVGDEVSPPEDFSNLVSRATRRELSARIF